MTMVSISLFTTPIRLLKILSLWQTYDFCSISNLAKNVNSILSQKHNRRKYEWSSCFLTQEEISRYKKLYQEMFTERNQLKQQCTQAIRQWDSAIRERNDYKDQYTKVTMHNNIQYSVYKNIYAVNVTYTYLVT